MAATVPSSGLTSALKGWGTGVRREPVLAMPLARDESHSEVGYAPIH